MAGDDPGGPILLLDMEVKLPGRTAYRASLRHQVPQRLAGKVGPGLQVPVAVDRDDPEHALAVDWDRVG